MASRYLISESDCRKAIIKQSCVGVNVENTHGGPPALDWSKRKHIALGAARGLSYLHEHCDPKIIHRDVKVCMDSDSPTLSCVLLLLSPSDQRLCVFKHMLHLVLQIFIT